MLSVRVSPGFFIKNLRSPSLSDAVTLDRCFYSSTAFWVTLIIIFLIFGQFQQKSTAFDHELQILRDFSFLIKRLQNYFSFLESMVYNVRMKPFPVGSHDIQCTDQLERRN